MRFKKLLSNKQYCLIASFQKNYLQINTFLANGSRVEKISSSTIESYCKSMVVKQEKSFDPLKVLVGTTKIAKETAG